MHGDHFEIAIFPIRKRNCAKMPDQKLYLWEFIVSTVTQALVFVLDDSTGALQVTFMPTPQPKVSESHAMGGTGDVIVIDNEVPTQEDEDATPPSMISCKEAMDEQGYGAFWIDEEAMSGFIRATQQAKEPTTMTVAHRRDGEYSLIVSDDLMSATLTLIPPQGGVAQGPAVIDAMREQGIVHGILQPVLNAALAAGVCEKLVIARGEWPIEGSVCYFTSLLKSEDSADDEAQEADEGEDDGEDEEEDDRFKIIKYRD